MDKKAKGTVRELVRAVNAYLAFGDRHYETFRVYDNGKLVGELGHPEFVAWIVKHGEETLEALED